MKFFSKSYQLLINASFFEKVANQDYSVEELSEELKEYETEPYIHPAHESQYRNSFSHLNHFLSVNFNTLNVSYDNFMSWVEKNKDYLDITKNWFFDSYNNYITYPKVLDRYVCITSESIEPKNTFENQNAIVYESSLLQKDGEIPQLWLWVISWSTESPILPSHLAHNNFLVTSIKSLFPLKATNEKIYKFIKDNNDKISKIRSQFEVSNPEYLGGGVDGLVYSISNNKVLKIFQHRYAYDQALKAMQRIFNNPDLSKTEAMIYDAGIIGNYDGDEVFYYIMEKMRPVTSLESNIKYDLYKIIQKIIYLFNEDKIMFKTVKQLIDHPYFSKEIREEVQIYSNQIANKIKEVHKSSIERIEFNINLRSNWLESLCEEIIMKYLTGRTDLHLGNIGITGYGDFRYFDPAFIDYTSEFNF